MRARWKHASTFLGRVRQWVGHSVLRRRQETCGRCGREYGAFLWWAPNDDWPRFYEQAVGRPPVTSSGRDWPCHSGLLCPRCYERAARALGVILTWQPVITHERADGTWRDVAVGIERVYGTPASTGENPE